MGQSRQGRQGLDMATLRIHLLVTIHRDRMDRHPICHRRNLELARIIGDTMAFSNLRFGYQETEDGDIIPEPTEQAILQEIKRLTILGRSSAQIAAELNNQGYRTRNQTKWVRKQRIPARGLKHSPSSCWPSGRLFGQKTTNPR